MRCALALLGLWVCSCGAAVSYCGARVCGLPGLHTFCQYPPGPSPSCRGYMESPLSSEEKGRIVARLNRRRGEAAQGRLRNYAPAGNMLKLRWVEELARAAQRWADQCRPPAAPDERDLCRDLYSTTVGQCVASVVGEAPGLRVESLADVWYMQSALYRGNLTYYAPPMSNVSFYGDFAQMVWSRSYMVGCGRSRFMSSWGGRVRSVERLVCNMAPAGPRAGSPLWAPAPPASLCPPRSVPDADHPALCNYQRELDASSDVDGAMSIEEHVLLSIVLEIEDKPILDYPGSLDELYMTKLAVVTMDSVSSTDSYNNQVHKRDLIESLGLDENVVRIDNVMVQNDLNELINATRVFIKVDKEPPKAVTKKKILIGRPKSYNIEDLNSIDGDHINLQQELNDHDDLPRREMSKIDRDVYLDYEFFDENTSETTSNMVTNDTKDTPNTMRTMTINEFTETKQSQNDSITTNVEDTNTLSYSSLVTNSNISSTTDFYFGNVTNNMNASNDDDYFSDPETVRELQEALDRMEKSMSDPPASKVRRELRNQNQQNTPPENHDEENLQQGQEISEDHDSNKGLPEAYRRNNDQEENKTDKSPMLNMVLKYLPYLKPYEKEIMGGAAGSTGSTLAISYILLSGGVVFTFYSF